MVDYFKKNDIIQYHDGIGALGWIRSCSETHLFITWMGSGDSMLWRNEMKGYEKVGEVEPGTADEFMFTGKIPFAKH